MPTVLIKCLESVRYSDLQGEAKDKFPGSLVGGFWSGGSTYAVALNEARGLAAAFPGKFEFRDPQAEAEAEAKAAEPK